MTQDILDSRDLQEEIEELESIEERDDAEQVRLDELLELKEDTEDSGWEYGIIFISDDDFEDYAVELAEEIGSISNNASWPYTCIDWEKAAKELKQDYNSIVFNGTDYWYREA